METTPKIRKNKKPIMVITTLEDKLDIKTGFFFKKRNRRY